MDVKSENVFDIADCSFGYRGKPCLNSICQSLDAGRFYGLIGPNGSGKTTLINLLTGTSKPDSGRLLLYNNKLDSYSKPDLARLLSHVPQNFSMEFDYTVYEVVMMGRHPYIPRFGNPSADDIERVESALKTLDIYSLKTRYVTHLSGGERQRVLVARALAQNTGVVILDEATASLDVRHSIDIMIALRKRVVSEKVTVIAALHDLELAAAFCDELLVMNKGEVYASGSVDAVLTPRLLKEIFAVEATVSPSYSGKPHIQYRYGHAS